jgi:hypothetical protein
MPARSRDVSCLILGLDIGLVFALLDLSERVTLRRIKCLCLERG